MRSLVSSGGENLEEAGPSIAVQMVGLNTVPTAGDEFAVLESEQEVSSTPSLVLHKQNRSSFF